MKKIERSLQINMAVMVTLSTVLLSIGQENLVFPMLVCFAAVTSVFFTDIVKWFRLNRHIANVAAVIGLAFSVKGYLHFDGKSNLIAVANLLICLQIILLYQQKNIRTYWYLCILSLLQVVVAAALNLGLVFGLLLAVYVVSAISALVFFFVYRETLQLEKLVQHKSDSTDRVDPELKSSYPSSTSQQALPHLKSMAYQNCKPDALVRSLIRSKLIGQITMVSLVSMVFSAVFFYCTPRQSSSSWHGAASRHVMTTGISDTMTLPTDGRIYESDVPVMRVTFYEGNRRDPSVMSGNFYFRARTFETYMSHSYAWDSLSFQSRRSHPLEQAASSQEIVRQVIVLEPQGRSILFGVFPAFAVSNTSKSIHYDVYSKSLRYLSYDRRPLHKPYRYVIGTTAFKNGVQSNVITQSISNEGLQDSFLIERQIEGLTRLDTDRLGKLALMAEEIVHSEQIQSANHHAIAKTLENHFLDSGLYSYSLDLGIVQRDRTIDPIEDFVINHRTGHCEYFAGALTLMLRSQGIPARMISGYKRGEFNSVGKYYQIRQRHSHAWVEAFVASDNSLQPENGRVHGIWLRLDPTPSTGSVGETSENATLWSTVDDTVEYAQILWSDYVVGFDFDRQQGTIISGGLIFTPSGEMIRRWKDLAEQMVVFSKNGLGELIRSQWWSWLGRLLLVCVVLIGTGIWVFIRWKRGSKGPFHSSSHKRTHSVTHIEFYDRMVSLLEQIGLQRGFGQTQLEFAVIAEKSLSETAYPSEVVVLPHQIVEAYYQVRFGGSELDNVKKLDVERALDRLHAALTNVGNLKS